MEKIATIIIPIQDLVKFNNQYQIELELMIRKQENIDDLKEIHILSLSKATNLTNTDITYQVKYKEVMDSEMADNIYKMEERVRGGL